MRSKTTGSEAKQVEYKEIAKKIVFPINDKTKKTIVEWIKKNATKPGFDINKIIIDQEEIVLDSKAKKFIVDLDKFKVSFIHYLIIKADTPVERELFLEIIDLIPSKRLKEFKEIDYTITEKDSKKTLTRIEIKKDYGETLAHYATRNVKYAKDFILKLHKKIDVNEGTVEFGTTPAHTAARVGNISALEALKACDINITTSGSKGVSPAEIAYFNDHKAAFDYLEKENKNFNPMIVYRLCAEYGLFTKMQELKKTFTIDVNFQNVRNKSTALQAAISNGDSEIIKYLIFQEKARLDLCDTNGFNALGYAVAFNDVKTIVDILKTENSASLINKNILFSVLAWPDTGKRYAITSLLVNKLAEAKNSDVLNAMTSEGSTPLHCATLFEHPKSFIDLLINTHLVDVNKKSKRVGYGSYTTLEEAVGFGHVKTIECLINIPSVEKDPINLMKIAVNYAAKDSLKVLIEQKFITDLPSCLHELAASQGGESDGSLKDSEKMQVMLKYILSQLTAKELVSELPQALSNAIKANNKNIALLLAEKITQELTFDQALMLQQALKAHPMPKVSRFVNRFSPKVDKTRVSIPFSSPAPSADEIKKQNDRFIAGQIQQLQEAMRLYELQFSRLATTVENASQFDAVKPFASGTEAKAHENKSQYQNFKRMQDPVDPSKLTSSIDEITHLTTRLNMLQTNLDKKIHDMKKSSRPLSTEKEVKPVKTKKPKKKKVKPAVITEPVKTVYTAPELAAINNEVKIPETKTQEELALHRKNQRNNIKEVIDQYKRFTKKIDTVITQDTNEKTAYTLLKQKFADKKISENDLLAVKYFLESMFVELANNVPMGLGRKSQQTFRNGNLYKLFSRDNCSYKTPLDREKITHDIANLWIALHDYLQCLDSKGRLKELPSSERSSLLNFLTEKTKDTRYVFDHTLFADGDKIAHQNYYDTYHEMLTSNRMTGSGWLDDEAKTFGQTYLWLRMVSEGSKANSNQVTYEQRGIANDWRHPGKESRKDIAAKVATDQVFVRSKMKGSRDKSR